VATGHAGDQKGGIQGGITEILEDRTRGQVKRQREIISLAHFNMGGVKMGDLGGKGFGVGTGKLEAVRGGEDKL